MSHVRARDACSFLAVTGGGSSENAACSFLEQASSGYLEVHTLQSPSEDEFRRALELHRPAFVYLQGDQLEDGAVSLAWTNCATADSIAGLFGHTLPVTIYLEIPRGEKLAEALHSKGIPYVIYWKYSVPRAAAPYFLHALLSVLKSSRAHAWDSFQLAHASTSFCCLQRRSVSSDDMTQASSDLGLDLLGIPPEIDVSYPEEDIAEERDDLSFLPAVKIHDEDVSLRFLICGVRSSVDAELLGFLEHGLNALLTIEMRGSKLLGKFSAPQPLFDTETFSRDVVTMRCDLSTSSYAHFSLLLSGNTQTCFNDQLLENHIKKEIIGSQLVHTLLNTEDNKLPSSEPRLSASVACGAPVYEVSMDVPSWASQVLRQLALDGSHHCLVALGIASIQGLAVASFDKDDAERLSLSNSEDCKEVFSSDSFVSATPVWLRPPAPSRKRTELCQDASPDSHPGQTVAYIGAYLDKDGENRETKDNYSSGHPAQGRMKIAALRPVPHIYQRKMQFICETSQRDGNDNGKVQENSVFLLAKQRVVRPSSAYRKSSSRTFQARQIISLNPLPLKKHGCGRSSIQVCSEEEFLKDVMHFLTVRGHARLIPPGGLAEFPEAVLNAKRLDLYNLYKEVVSRGGFHVGNGINWKGQVFSKMSNYTMTHRMTGVGNTLKRHYETYLLEYELAHDDVDGECCLLCHSGAAGDWVNCGTCGEWAHFGCDRRQGLGAFKDYAKTDGLEYVCPQCSITSMKKKPHRSSNEIAKAY
ncbi:AT-rich interactive domain-containing protein 4-like [Syzygium oleosum]|uniref:AT-rich interactive domain-containing protein 4-like n=1 Tax=Syzygium oleosum TaxID=219896 RepID=UPI0011D2A9B9|nr:AT-rich interactive domain-containing protein 4-like [Syzygium oleosum]